MDDAPPRLPESRLGARPSGLRRHNLAAVAERLHRYGAASRSELGAATGLNRSTIADLVQELVARGLAVEDGVSPPVGPGRPSPVVHPRPAGAVALAVELGVESVAAAAIGLGGHVFDQLREDLPARRPSPADVQARVAGMTRALTAALPPDHELAGVGVAVPGLTRRTDGFVPFAPNLGWNQVPVGGLLAEALDVAPGRVRVANEADLGALGEHRRGAGRGYDHLVFVSGEVGIGAGLILGGTPMLGAAGYAGEAGHMLVNPTGRPCTCGSRGCWETEVGELALMAAVGAEGTTGAAAVAAVEERLAAGDPAAAGAVAEVGHWLGVGVGNLVNLLNPEAVVLGGLFQPLFGHLRPSMLAALHERTLAEVSSQLVVVPSALGTSAQLHGAAELCLAAVVADPVAAGVSQRA